MFYRAPKSKYRIRAPGGREQVRVLQRDSKHYHPNKTNSKYFIGYSTGEIKDLKGKGVS